jgi:hypothetical protein
VSTQTDNSNCGGCGVVCTGGQTCINGTCTCPNGLTFCNSNCVDISTDPNNCGGCGNVCNGTCTSGQCCQIGYHHCPQGGCCPDCMECDPTGLPYCNDTCTNCTICYAPGGVPSQCIPYCTSDQTCCQTPGGGGGSGSGNCCQPNEHCTNGICVPV